jgi:hypothetical protein
MTSAVTLIDAVRCVVTMREATSAPVRTATLLDLKTDQNVWQSQVRVKCQGVCVCEGERKKRKGRNRDTGLLEGGRERKGGTEREGGREKEREREREREKMISILFVSNSLQTILQLSSCLPTEWTSGPWEQTGETLSDW